MCDCFTCKHSKDIPILYGYYYAEYTTLKGIYDYLERLGYKCGSLSGKDSIETLMAIIKCNKMEAGCILQEVENMYSDMVEKFMLDSDGITF